MRVVFLMAALVADSQAARSPLPVMVKDYFCMSKPMDCVLVSNLLPTLVDDVRNYQLALLEYGMLYLNFCDAISEGDGLRILR